MCATMILGLAFMAQICFSACEVFYGKDILGGTFSHHANSGATNIATDAACNQLCLDSAGCRAWVRQPSTKKCWLSKQSGAINWEAESDRNGGFVCDGSGATCPATHPYAYRPMQNFDYCCATSGDCNGSSDINAGERIDRSGCCEDHKYSACPNPPCSDYVDPAPLCGQVNFKRTPIDGVSGQGRSVESSWQECQERCASVAGCSYFSYWPNGGCHLQSASATLVAHTGITTGPAACAVEVPTSVVVLDGGSGKFAEGTCLSTSATQLDGVKIAAQCCEADTCRRYVGANDADGCTVGMTPNIEGTTYEEAATICAKKGMSVCDNNCAHTGCGYDFHPVWTSTPCDIDYAYCTKSNGEQFVNECVLEKFAENPNSNICGPCGCSGCGLVKPPTPPPTAPPTTATGLRCGVLACASYYYDITGTKIANLRGAAKFPDSPDASVPLKELVVPEDTANNYGVLLEAWVRAPTTGEYVFSTYSDDSSEVYIATTPGVIMAEDEMTKVVELDGCCRKVTGTTKVTLEAGMSYYLLGYMKEGGGRDYFQIGFTVNGEEYFPLQGEYTLGATLGYEESTIPPICETTGSHYTELMLVEMNNAAREFGACAADIHRIADTLDDLNLATTIIKALMEDSDKIMEKIDGVFDSIAKAQIGNILGKIPKIGMFIKIGIKAADKVVEALQPLFELIKNWAGVIDNAVWLASKTFTGLKWVATPTSVYLSGSHSALSAAHQCAQATGYECGSAGARLEAKNKAKYPKASEELEKIATVGETCHALLNPMETAMKQLAAMADKLAKLLEPLQQVLEKVQEWVAEMEEQIKKFVDALMDSPATQCVLEIFESGTDSLNLITCPIDELIGAVMHYIVDQLIVKAAIAVQTATNNGITDAVDALVPDGLDIRIPDFTAILPHDEWFYFCQEAAQIVPGLPNTVSEFLSLDLPYHVTSKDMEEEILDKALIQSSLTEPVGEYHSACVEAWNEFGGDMENCKKILNAIADAAKEAACEAATLAHKANVGLVSGAQSASNAARAHFNSAQSDFNAANNDLAKAQNDLNAANTHLQKKKDDCPNCSCRSCKWHQASCIVESAWCCPARKTCLAAISLAQVGVNGAKGTVSAAQATVRITQAAYIAAERELAASEETLSRYRTVAAASAVEQAAKCDRRRRLAQRLLK